jgi:hypothetical protein
MKKKFVSFDLDYIGSQDPRFQPKDEDFAAISQYIQEQKRSRAAELSKQHVDALERASRSFVLAQSLYVEKLASRVIAELLGIDRGTSSVLGNTSKALSFNTKIDLLMDLEVLNKKDKAKFLTFMEIRNQFMHNSEAVSFVECLKFLNGKERWLLDNYPQDSNHSLEERLRDSFDDLAKDIINLTMSVYNIVEERNKESLQKAINNIAFEILPESINDVVEVFNKVINNLISSESYDISNLRNIGNRFGKLFNQTFKQRFDEAMQAQGDRLVNDRIFKNL